MGPVLYSNSLREPVESSHLSIRRLLVELFGYGVASAAALAVDVTLLKALVSRVGWHYLPAATLSFIAGASVAYALSVRLAFDTRRLKNRAVEFTCFAALGIVGLVVNGVAISVGISVGLGLVPAKLVAALCTFTTNFALRRLFLFSPKTAEP